uniref:Uncharacterized protein n=1 Tax=Globodera pallida TaxID=36090 RepID=A0A183C4U2_GLOPA
MFIWMEHNAGGGSNVEMRLGQIKAHRADRHSDRLQRRRDANVVEGRDSGNKAQHQQQNNGGSSQRLDDEDANVVEGRAELVRSASRVKQHQVESGNILELVKARQTKKALQANIVVKLEEDQKQAKVVGMEQQHLQQQLVPALNERVEQLELELKEMHTKFEQQLEELETI